MTMLCDGMLLDAGGAPTSTGVEFVSAASEVSGGTTSTLVVDAPEDLQAGDLIVCVLWVLKTFTAVDISSRPSGFSSAISRVNADGYNAFIEIKVATGSEPSTYTWTFDQSSINAKRFGMLVYRGATGVDVSMAGFNGPTSSTTQSTSSITATQDGALISIFLCQSNSRTITSGPAGMTNRIQPPTPALSAMAVYDLIPSPAGGTGAKTAIWSGSASNQLATQLQIY